MSRKRNFFYQSNKSVQLTAWRDFFLLKGQMIAAFLRFRAKFYFSFFLEFFKTESQGVHLLEQVNEKLY